MRNELADASIARQGVPLAGLRIVGRRRADFRIRLGRDGGAQSSGSSFCTSAAKRFELGLLFGRAGLDAEQLVELLPDFGLTNLLALVPLVTRSLPRRVPRPCGRCSN